MLILAAASDAHAGPTDDPPVTLVWTAPKECPSGAEVSARTAERLPPDATVRAKGRVEKRPGPAGKYSLVLEIESRGERVIEAGTCKELASSAAVVLAMSVAPPAKEKEEPAPAPAPPAAAPPPPKPETAAPPPDRDAGKGASRAGDHRTTFGARLQGIGDIGTLPSPGAGGGIAIGLDPTARLHLEISGNLWASQDGRLAADPSRGASFQLWTAGARGCFALTKPSSVVALAPCLGAEVIVLSASGFGAAKSSDATSITWAPEALATLSFALGDRIRVRAGLGAAAPTSRQAFVIAATGEVHRPSAIVARGWIGPEIVF